MTAELILNIATLVAALAAAVTGIWAVRRAGFQKLAEFRKEWIENLRLHLAEYLAMTYAVRALDQITDIDLQKNDPELAKLKINEYQTSLNRLVQLQSYITMMLNEDEDSHRSIIESMQLFTNSIRSGNSPEFNYAEFEHNSRIALKSEWKRVKDEI